MLPQPDPVVHYHLPAAGGLPPREPACGKDLAFVALHGDTGTPVWACFEADSHRCPECFADVDCPPFPQLEIRKLRARLAESDTRRLALEAAFAQVRAILARLDAAPETTPANPKEEP
jgi:hypothetical protein